MSPQWNNAVHAGAGASASGGPVGGRRHEHREGANSWDVLSDRLNGLSVNENAFSGPGWGQTPSPNVRGWDQSPSVGAWGQQPSPNVGGWGHSPSPNAGGWGHTPYPNVSGWSNPNGFAENSGSGSGWGAWPSRQASVQAEVEEEVEADPFGPEANNISGGGGNAGINFDAYEDIPVEVTGDGVPPPAESFADFDLGDALSANVKRCKYTKPTPIQRHAIPIALAGRDLMACAQTGSGKTAAFCFPIISGILSNGLTASRGSPGGGGSRDWWHAAPAYPVALILSPTRELCCQIHDEAKKFAYQTGVKVTVAYGGAPMVNQLRNLQKGVDILVATPGRLIDIIERERVSLSKVKYLTLDEADRMLDMGFEQQVRKIVQQMEMPAPGIRQTMLFSATFPHEIQMLHSRMSDEDHNLSSRHLYSEGKIFQDNATREEILSVS